LKAYIRIAGMPLLMLINIRISVYVILKNLTRKFKLRIEVNDETKVALLRRRSKVKVISFIFNTLIVIQNFHILGLLYVIGGIKSVVIFRTDWMDHY